MEAETRTFPGTPASVADARRFVGQLLTGTSYLDEALLLTSEAATNAVCHSGSGVGGEYAVTVRPAGSRVRVQVEDQGGTGEVPTMRHPTLDAESGRGVAFLNEYAASWGYDARADGTVVWFEFDLEPALATAAA